MELARLAQNLGGAQRRGAAYRNRIGHCPQMTQIHADKAKRFEQENAEVTETNEGDVRKMGSEK